MNPCDRIHLCHYHVVCDIIDAANKKAIPPIACLELGGINTADVKSVEEKLKLLLKIRDNEIISWSGKFRPALQQQAIYPRPLQNPIPIWVGVGGTPASFVRAGTLGLPLMVAIIGGETHRFLPLIDLYKKAGIAAGHTPEKLKVGLHSLGYVGNSREDAINDYFPGYAETFTRIGRERGWHQLQDLISMRKQEIWVL